jgi:hypothetical protein
MLVKFLFLDKSRQTCKPITYLASLISYESEATHTILTFVTLNSGRSEEKLPGKRCMLILSIKQQERS